MSQFSDVRHFTINDIALENKERFTYFGLTITMNTTVDQELSMQFGKAFTTFGRLPKCVWKNCHFSIRTKVLVYKDWATYQPQESVE